jgi:hypothetical protein
VLGVRGDMISVHFTGKPDVQVQGLACCLMLTVNRRVESGVPTGNTMAPRTSPVQESFRSSDEIHIQFFDSTHARDEFHSHQENAHRPLELFPDFVTNHLLLLTLTPAPAAAGGAGWV